MFHTVQGKVPLMSHELAWNFFSKATKKICCEKSSHACQMNMLGILIQTFFFLIPENKIHASLTQVSEHVWNFSFKI